MIIACSVGIKPKVRQAARNRFPFSWWPVPPHSRRAFRRTPDPLPAQPEGLGHAGHRSPSPRGVLDHPLQADRTGAGVGHRTVAPFVATDSDGVPDPTDDPDPRRYDGSAPREIRAGDQHPARSLQRLQASEPARRPGERNTVVGCPSVAVAAEKLSDSSQVAVASPSTRSTTVPS
jgi:hypothetical protein